jgi:hypothetical protein
VSVERLNNVGDSERDKHFVYGKHIDPVVGLVRPGPAVALGVESYLFREVYDHGDGAGAPNDSEPPVFYGGGYES